MNEGEVSLWHAHWMKAALAGMAIMAMTAPVHAADTIKIGVPGAHSGDLVSYGMPSLNAARIVADEYNAKGGILGKQIEIIAEDDQCKPELGTNAATKVLSEAPWPLWAPSVPAQPRPPCRSTTTQDRVHFSVGHHA